MPVRVPRLEDRKTNRQDTDRKDDKADPERDPTEAKDPEIQLTPPGTDELFRVESETAALRRIRREAEARGIKVSFPESATPSREAQALPPRPPAGTAAAFVSVPLCHNPLYFEDRSTERYGWHIHGLQPAISTVRFYLDFLALPYQVLRRPPCSLECDNSLPLPGDPVPYAWHVGGTSTGLAIRYDPGYFDFCARALEF